MRFAFAVLLASTSSFAQPTADVRAVVRSADYGLAGTIVLVERTREGCWDGRRVLVHVEADLRPARLDDEDTEQLLWMEARLRRSGDSACQVLDEYVGDVALLRPGTRVALFGGISGIDRAGYSLDVRQELARLTYAAPFEDLPRLADLLGPRQTMWEWLAPVRGALKRKGEVAIDAASGLVWQWGRETKRVAEGVAYEYCDGLRLGGRDDWRVPSTTEILTLAPRSLSGGSDELFWTWHDGASAEPWVASFHDLTIEDTHYDDPNPYGPYFVRCVAGHLAPAKRILVHAGYTVARDELVDLEMELAWRRTGVPAATHAAAQRACVAPWRLPTEAELRANSLRRRPEQLYEQDILLWASDAKNRLYEPDRLLTVVPGDGFDDGKKRVALCVQPRPRAQVKGERNYPSGDVFAAGPKRYWELGTLAWDGARSYYPDGRKASERTSDVLTLFARDGKQIGSLRFTNAALTGKVQLTTPEVRISANARDGELDGSADLSTDKRTERGTFSRGAREGAWIALASGKQITSTTFRSGMREGPASSAERGTWTGAYRDGFRDGVWKHVDGKERSEATFARGTGVWKFWVGKQQTREERYTRDVRDGEMKVWEPTGKLSLRIVYDHGREVENESIDSQGRTLRTRDRELKFHANGKKASEVGRRNGRSHGTYTAWDEQGKVIESGAFDNGMRTGEWRRRIDGNMYIQRWRADRIVAVPRVEKAR